MSYEAKDRVSKDTEGQYTGTNPNPNLHFNDDNQVVILWSFTMKLSSQYN